MKWIITINIVVLVAGIDWAKSSLVRLPELIVESKCLRAIIGEPRSKVAQRLKWLMSPFGAYSVSAKHFHGFCVNRTSPLTRNPPTPIQTSLANCILF